MVIWKRSKEAHKWRYADILLIMKNEGLKVIDWIRAISLLSVEGKLFFSIAVLCLTCYYSCLV